VREFLGRVFSESEVSSAFLGFLFQGTGGFIAQLALALIALFYFYDQGPRIVRGLLDYTPLDRPQRALLRGRFHATVLRLLTDTIALAVIKGLCMASIAWIIAVFPFFIIAAVATFISLLPVVGFTFVWLPLASLLWAQGQQIEAACLAVASLSAGWLIPQLSERLTRTLHPHSIWMGFLLFLSLVGGIIAFGVKGFVVGPMAVVITSVLGSFWLPLYGIGKPDSDPLDVGKDTPPLPEP
jgi:predicted PurR-regulated permease PerM